MDDARALLNSLMGNDRNARPEQRKTRKFTDEDNCRNYLLGLCPHDLFTNTKIDLGICEKEHNEFMKDAFDADPDNMKYRRKWRGNLRIQLRRLLEGVDRRIGSNQLRIAREKEGGPAGASEEQKQQLAALKEEVSEKLKSAERSAEEGRYDESRNIVKDTEAVKRRIEDLEQKRYEKYRKEDICEICGLIIDAEEAEAMKTGRGWHSNGKQHIGYNLIRKKLKELEEEQARDKAKGLRSPTPSPVRPPPRQEIKRKKSASRSPARGKSDGRRRKGSKSRSPSRRRRKPSRSRSRRRKASRSRSRSRKKKSRSRKRSRSKEKKHSKSTKESSPKRRSRSLNGGREKEKEKEKEKDKEKEKKKKKASKAEETNLAKGDAAKEDPKPPALPPPPPPKDGEKEKKSKKASSESSKVGQAAVAEPPEIKSAPELGKTDGAAEAAAMEAEEGARNRARPVFMVFRRKDT